MEKKVYQLSAECPIGCQLLKMVKSYGVNSICRFVLNCKDSLFYRTPNLRLQLFSFYSIGFKPYAPSFNFTSYHPSFTYQVLIFIDHVSFENFSRKNCLEHPTTPSWSYFSRITILSFLLFFNRASVKLATKVNQLEKHCNPPHAYDDLYHKCSIYLGIQSL